jgi:predicted transcriptional regulator
MATTLKPETEEKLARLADSMHRPKEEILEDAITRLLEYSQLLDRKANGGVTSGSTDTDFVPVEIKGEPMSTTVMRERR